MLKNLLISSSLLKWYIVLFFILLVYLTIILIYAENIPFTDDLSVLASLYELKHEPDWYLKFKTLFAFHNEHRIAVPRLFTTLLYYVGGKHINISWWVITGNLFLFVPLYLLFKTGFTKKNIAYFLPVLLIVLQPMHHELMYWGMASLQNVGVLALSALCLYCLVYTENFLYALLLAILAVFTSVNGIFVLIMGAALLGYRRDIYKFAPWLLTGSLLIYLYWNGFSVEDNSGKTLSESFHFFGILTIFTRLVGGIVYAQSAPILSLVWGIFLLIIMVLVLYSRFFVRGIRNDKSQQFLICYLGFTFLTIAAISLGRGGENVLLVSRYKLYSALVVILLYTIVLKEIEGRTYIFSLILLLGAAFWVLSYIRYVPSFKNHSQLLFSHFFNWRYSNMLDVSPESSERYYADCWKKLYQSGDYIFPKDLMRESQQVISQMDTKNSVNMNFSVHNQVVSINPITLPVNDYYIVCKDQNKIAIYPLTASSLYHNFFSHSGVNYVASINYSYWIKSLKSQVFLVTVN